MLITEETSSHLQHYAKNYVYLSNNLQAKQNKIHWHPIIILISLKKLLFQ